MAEAIQAAKLAADAHFRNKRFADAADEYNKAIALCEQHRVSEMLHLLYSNSSAAKLALKDFQGALADAQASVAVNPSWVKGWYRSAKALQGLGKHDLAVQAAAKAEELDPGNKDVQQLLAQLQQHKQQHQHQEPQPQPQQQQQHQAPSTHPNQQLPWQQLNKLRSHLDLKLLPSALVQGSRYIPSPDGVNYNLLLLLHGLGDKPAPFTALAERMHLPQTACLALSGPLAVPETDGGRAWFTAFDEQWELIQPRRGETRRTSSLASTVQLLQELVFESLPAAGGWRSADVQLLAFSQGATAALELARSCQGSRQLGGVVAISAALLEEQIEQPEPGGPVSSSSNTVTQGGSNISRSSSGGASQSTSSSSSSGSGPDGTPVLITHGDKDDVISRDVVNRTVVVLQGSGCQVQLKTLPAKGHAMIGSSQEMHACMEFWGKRLKHRPADPSFVEV